MGLLDFLKTQPNEQGQSQWDWGKIAPLAAIAVGTSGSMLNGIQEGNERAQERKRQANIDAWNKMIQDEQLKELQRRNATIDITPAMGEQFKGTKYEPFIWNPGETKTQSTQDYLKNVGVMNPGGINLTGQITTEKPESLKETSMNRNEYLGMVNDIEAQKAAKDAADMKVWLEQQKSDEEKRRWEAEQELRRKRLEIERIRAAKGDKPPTFTENLLKQYRAEEPLTSDAAGHKLPVSVQDYARKNFGDPGERTFMFEQTGDTNYLNPGRTVYGMQKGLDINADRYLAQYNQANPKSTLTGAIDSAISNPNIPKQTVQALIDRYNTNHGKTGKNATTYEQWQKGAQTRQGLAGKGGNKPSGQTNNNNKSSHGKVIQTGTYDGKKVVKYEDGFIEYKS